MTLYKLNSDYQSQTDDQTAVEAELRDEIKAIESYDADIQRTTNPELKKIFEHIKAEEEQHKAMLEEFIKGGKK